MPMPFGMLKRLRVPEFARSCSPVVALFEPGRQRIGSVFVLLMLPVHEERAVVVLII